MDKLVLVINTSYSTKMTIIPFSDEMAAKRKLVERYDKCLKEHTPYDVYNTFIADDQKYAQIAIGFETIEFSIQEVYNESNEVKGD